MNTANKITMLRILLIPLFIFFMENMHLPYAGWICIAIFAAASVTDWLDGYIARKYNQVTTFGKFVDPLADKLLVTAAFIEFVFWGIMPAWAVWLILAREFMVTSLRIVAISEGKVIAASMIAKVKTVVQMLTVILLLFSRVMVFGAMLNSATQIMIWATIVITLVSGADYLKNSWSLLKFR